MRVKASALVAVLSLMAAAVPVSAHHSFAAEYDANKPITITGTVTKLEWMNPHARFYVEVKDADGKVTNWMIEVGAPNGLLRRGFTKQSLLPGTDIMIEGWQAKDGSNRANGSNITLPDGKKLFVGSQGTGAPTEGPK